jgi:hypothetical protein
LKLTSKQSTTKKSVKFPDEEEKEEDEADNEEISKDVSA